MEKSQNGQQGKPPKRNELLRLLYACKYTYQGLKAAIIHEPPVRSEFIVLLILIPTVILLPLTFLESGVIIALWILVIVGELINSVFELFCDRQTHEFDPIIKRIKDYGSAVVFLLIVNWLIISLGIFIKNL